MATYATLTINAEDIIGANFDPSRASVWIEANTEHSTIVVDGTTVRVGGRSEKFVDGVATFELVTTNSADNPTSFSYRGGITYIEKGSRHQGRKTLPISDFPLTADANLAAIPEAWDGLTVPAVWRSEFRTEMEALKDATSAIAGADTADELIAAVDLDTGSTFRQQQDARNPRVYDNFADRPTGALTEAHRTRSGHPINLYDDGGGFTVSSGALVHTITAGQTAAYLGVQTPDDVRTMWAEVKWTSTAKPSDEIAVFVVSDAVFENTGTYPDAGAHVIFGRDSWTYQTYDGGVGPVMKDTASYDALPYGEWHRFGLSWDGANVTLHFPDGNTRKIASDATIGAWWGPHATFELFSTGNQNPAAIRALTAASDVTIPAPTPDVLTGKAEHIKAPATTSTNITGGFTVVDSMTITVPASQRLAVLAQERVNMTSGNLYSQVDLGGNATATQYQELVAGEACNRSVTVIAVLDLSEFPAGSVQTLNVRLLSTAATATHRLDAGSNQRQTLMATPIAEAAFA